MKTYRHQTAQNADNLLEENRRSNKEINQLILNVVSRNRRDYNPPPPLITTITTYHIKY